MTEPAPPAGPDAGGVPFLARDYDELAAIATGLYVQRRDARAQLVASVGEEEADARIRAMAAVAADWRRVADLYAGRVGPDQPRDAEAIASPAEKAATLELAVRRTAALADRSRAKLESVLSKKQRALFNELSRETLAEAVSIHDCPELHHHLAHERRHWAVEALLWHARHPRSPVFFAELTAEYRDRARAAVAA